jgi:Domain of unknown function (DUF397)
VINQVWRKSSFSSINGACVEVRTDSGTVQVRDTKNPDSPVLGFTSDEWAAFTAGVRAGEFDL